ncbi:DNA repair protein RecN [Desertibaculum subflavum]|uniref:DNA repair protein RecN n=1 Tax=Desertibaculum subflavum TaxID=2268458 RepID=UPI000E67117E
MLRELAIRDIILIEALDLSFGAGLSVLTGETGAGKSILLDSLGLALGGRAVDGLVRAGAERGSVAARFDLIPDHPARALLDEQGINVEGDELVLRRSVAADGRTRAFVNDEPVSIGLLRRVGETLVEIHGQHSEVGLLDPATHGPLLDIFAGATGTVAEVAAAHAAARVARDQAEAARRAVAEAGREEDYIRHALAELDKLAPESGEEAGLAERRLFLQGAEKTAEAVREALEQVEGSGHSVAQRLRLAARSVGRVAPRAAGHLDAALAALSTAGDAIAEVESALAAAGRALDFDDRELERVEERLFALRAAARKHGCAVDDLAQKRDALRRQLDLIESGEGALKAAEAAEAAATARYVEIADGLSRLRVKAAAKLDKAVMAELKPLRLGTAVFATTIERLAEPDWGPGGIDRIRFEVATNPGSPAGPLAKIASGGELARFMLALNLALARRGGAPVLVFDEIDRGIGGATAAAVGERLARLSEKFQVLVVTHSPQVAARGAMHLTVAKSARGKALPKVEVTSLDRAARREEIARMLAGASITDQARAAAESLLAGERV